MSDTRTVAILPLSPGRRFRKPWRSSGILINADSRSSSIFLLMHLGDMCAQGRVVVQISRISPSTGVQAVSYTHLDVYKRQTPRFAALQATASARSRHDSAPDDQKAQWNTTAAPLPSSSKQAATTGSRPRGGCLLPFPACAGHGQKARSAQSGTAWPTRMRVDRGSRPTVQIGQHGGIAAKGS